MLLAGLDGIKRKLDPGKPMDMNLFDLSEADKRKVKFVPSSLNEAFEALEEDHDFLTKPGVFTESFIANYMHMKEQQMDEIRLRPHPHEFQLYYTL